MRPKAPNKNSMLFLPSDFYRNLIVMSPVSTPIEPPQQMDSNWPLPFYLDDRSVLLAIGMSSIENPTSFIFISTSTSYKHLKFPPLTFFRYLRTCRSFYFFCSISFFTLEQLRVARRKVLYFAIVLFFPRKCWTLAPFPLSVNIFTRAMRNSELIFLGLLNSGFNLLPLYWGANHTPSDPLQSMNFTLASFSFVFSAFSVI